MSLIVAINRHMFKGVWALVFCMQALQDQHHVKTTINNNTLLWEISGNGLAQPAFIFGTFHLLCRDDIHLSAAEYKRFWYFSGKLRINNQELGEGA